MSFTGIDSDYNLNAGSREETGKKTGKKVARRATPDYIRNDKIIMKTSTKTLYINKENGLPEKMKVQDNDKKTAVYILYSEVNVNS